MRLTSELARARICPDSAAIHVSIARLTVEPVPGQAELAVDVARGVEGGVVQFGSAYELKGPAQDLGGEDALVDVLHLGGEIRGWGGRVGDALRILEIVLVVAPAAAHRQGQGYRCVAATGSAHPLLVVEPGGGHVGHQHDGERADVDTGLHGGGHREDVKSVGARVLRVVEEHPLEAGLAALGFDTVCLAGEFRGVEAEVADLVLGHPCVVVVVQWPDGRSLCWQLSSALRAGAGPGVEVTAMASAAWPGQAFAVTERDLRRLDDVLDHGLSPCLFRAALHIVLRQL